MEEGEKKQVSFAINDGESFFADEVSITNNPIKFIFDFKNNTPRIDIRSQETLPIVIKHSVVVMDMYLAKVFSKLLNEHIQKYEQEFGEIHKPDAIAKVEQMLKENKKSPVTSTVDDHPTYFG